MDPNEEIRNPDGKNTQVSIQISSIIEATGKYIQTEVWGLELNTYFTIFASEQLLDGQKVYVFSHWADAETTSLVREIYVDGNKEYIAYYREV